MPGAWPDWVSRRPGRKTRRGLRRYWAGGGLFGTVSTPPTTVESQSSTADTDVLFFGEPIAKLGPKKYRITNGGFTTCVQPTPRWELHSSTVVLNLDQYTLLRSAVFR